MRKPRVGKFSTGIHGRREANRRPFTISNKGYDAAIIELQHFHDSEYLAKRGPGGGGQKKRVPAAPVNTSPPIVFGDPYIGETLMCLPGVWSGWPTPTYTYQWYQGSPGSETLIPGATSDSYITQPADENLTLFCRVRGENDEGFSFADSNVFGPIMDADIKLMENGVTQKLMEDGVTLKTLE